MNIHHLSVSKTARYVSLGELNQHTTEVWIVLHGYAQLATDFIQEFKALDNGSRYIVAPEGLNRFYAKGFGGKPAATWMTSEDREKEIPDYINYLDTLYEHLGLGNLKAKVVVLGFSQGVATASRWLNATVHAVNHWVICSGEIGLEFQQEPTTQLIGIPKTYITGDIDPFIDAEKHTRYKELMDKMGAETLVFTGGHHIHAESLSKVQLA
ncbi:MAG: phospholipase [Bacteroidia bacterium]